MRTTDSWWPEQTVVFHQVVTLGADDLNWASDVGRRRHLDSLLEARKVRFPEKRAGELWGNHIESAGAELAVARVSGREWTGHVNRFHDGPDIDGTNWEVRWSAIQKWKVNATHDTGRVVVCVDGQAPTYEVIGWIIPELVRRVPSLRRDAEDHTFWLVPKNLITRRGVPPVAHVTRTEWKVSA